LLFISRSHPLAAFVFSFYDCYGHLEGRQRIEVMKKIPPAESDGMNGLIQMCTGEACPSTFRSPVDGLPNITNNQVLTVIYKNPPIHRHIARPPEGVVMPKQVSTLFQYHPCTAGKQFHLCHDERVVLCTQARCAECTKTFVDEPIWVLCKITEYIRG
jgi:hypothetical protein